ncbi:MAG TPA: ROK family protein [Planctomycetota bacterium]|nr:ROK family protein [Planctomycetota bacterium]
MIGIDLGGTNLRGGLVESASRTILARERCVTAGGEGAPGRAGDQSPEAVAARIAFVIEKLLAQAEQRRVKVDAVGIGSPGPLDRMLGVIPETRNLGHGSWRDVPLVALVEKQLKKKLPVYLENDAICHLAGEFHGGAGMGGTDMIMLTLGTGVGGAVIIGGKMHYGADGTAGHLGAMPLDIHDSLHKQSGFFGTLEALASAPATAALAVELLKAEPGVASPLRAKMGAGIVAADVAAAAEAGCPIAKRVWERVGGVLGAAIATFVNSLNIDRAIIGGGAAAAWELFAPRMIAECKQRSWTTPFARLKIVPAKLGDDAGLIGAAFLARERSQTQR